MYQIGLLEELGEGVIQECSFGRWRSSNEAIFQIFTTFIEYTMNYDYVEAWTLKLVR
jgi:hypothetical protein